MNYKDKKYRKNPSSFPTIYTELFNTNGTTNASCYSDYSKKKAQAAEVCTCDDPTKCKCSRYYPPVTRTKRYNTELFKSPKPYLMYTIRRGDDKSTQFIFMGKQEQDAYEECERLNNLTNTNKGSIMPVIWMYYDEEKYNTRTISDYKEFMTWNEISGDVLSDEIKIKRR